MVQYGRYCYFRLKFLENPATWQRTNEVRGLHRPLQEGDWLCRSLGRQYLAWLQFFTHSTFRVPHASLTSFNLVSEWFGIVLKYFGGRNRVMFVF